MWLEEVINCLYEAGLQNDKLPLLFLENRNAQVAVKTSGGLSKRVDIKNIIMQGSVWGSICCVVMMDKLGKLIYNNPSLLYYYKGVVACPPLQMVRRRPWNSKVLPQVSSFKYNSEYFYGARKTKPK
jgi:hypothetical protein